MSLKQSFATNAENRYRQASGRADPHPRTPPALWALALGAFGVGMTEFTPIGLLPQIATTFDVTIPSAGWVVSAYAIGVLLGAPLMTVLGLHVPRKRMLMLLMGVYAAGNLLTALAPTYAVMLGGRVLTSFTHGAFFGLGAVVAAELVGQARRAAAVAFMFTGLTLANLAGVPLGTWLAAVTGWRSTFLAMTVLGLASATAIGLLVPTLTRPAGVDLRREVRALRDVQVLLAMLMTLLGFGGVFAAITYLAPMMTTVSGFAPEAMPWLLMVLGIGMVIGNWAGGRLADRTLTATVAGALGVLVLALAAFAFTAHSRPLAVLTVFVIGAVGFATVPPLQTVVMDRAAAAPTLASALNIGAFNLGNALAAWLAGLAIAAGHGYTSASWVGAALTGAGLAIAGLSHLIHRRRHAQP